jgi:Cdc6-like AAA superfamily ATPase
LQPKKPSALSHFGRDLNRLAKNGKLAPVIGRKPEMLRIAQTLLQSRKNNVILVGEAGVGKTGIVEGLAQRIAQGKVTVFRSRLIFVLIFMDAVWGLRGCPHLRISVPDAHAFVPVSGPALNVAVCHIEESKITVYGARHPEKLEQMTGR